VSPDVLVMAGLVAGSALVGLLALWLARRGGRRG
jgi:hypothetical protein